MIVEGYLKLSQPVDENTAKLINALADTPRLARDIKAIGHGFGVEGEFYTGDEVESAITPQRPPVSQPSMQLDWYITEDGAELHYDDAADIPIHSQKWLSYLITKIFQPKGIQLSGTVQFKQTKTGEEILTIQVENNKITIPE